MFKWIPAEWKVLITLLVLCIGMFFLTGCAMTNEEIARETKYCHVQGMGTRVLRNGMNATARIECVPLQITQP